MPIPHCRFGERLAQAEVLSIGQIFGGEKPCWDLRSLKAPYPIAPCNYDMHVIYIFEMDSVFDWNPEKNEELKARFGFGFERVVIAMAERGLLAERTHPNTARY